jgi:hypothetical protein
MKILHGNILKRKFVMMGALPEIVNIQMWGDMTAVK